MRGGRLRDTLELDHNYALVHPSLVGLRWHATHKKTPARSLNRGTGNFCVRSQCVRIPNRAIRYDPICLGHDFLQRRLTLSSVSFPAAFYRLLMLPTRYFSTSSPAFCFLFSQFAIRPRPDHVSPVTGSRYFSLASLLCGSFSLSSSRPSPGVPRLNGARRSPPSSSGRFKYAMLLSAMATSSQPSPPAALSRSRSSLRGSCWFKSILRYSHSFTALVSWVFTRVLTTRCGCARKKDHQSRDADCVVSTCLPTGGQAPARYK